MKLRVLTTLGAMAFLAVAGCKGNSEETVADVEAGAPAEQAAAEEAAQPAAVEPSAADVCNDIVEAAKAKDIDKIIGMSTPGAAEELSDESLRTGLMASLAEATCGEATPAADDANKAVVAVTAGDSTRDVPFVKGADGWRFDVATYLAKYAPPKKEEAPAPKKAKKGRKGRKGKKGKKGKRHKKSR